MAGIGAEGSVRGDEGSALDADDAGVASTVVVVAAAAASVPVRGYTYGAAHVPIMALVEDRASQCSIFFAMVMPCPVYANR